MKLHMFNSYLPTSMYYGKLDPQYKHHATNITRHTPFETKSLENNIGNPKTP